LLPLKILNSLLLQLSTCIALMLSLLKKSKILE